MSRACQFRKVGAVEAAVTRQESLGNRNGVCADQEVGNDALPWPPSFAITLLPQPRFVCHGSSQRGNHGIDRPQCPFQGILLAKRRHQLCIDDIADDDSTGIVCGTKPGTGLLAELFVRQENIG